MATNKHLDLTGKRYGKLTVLKEAEPEFYKRGNVKYRWLCRCDCGNLTIGSTDDLRRGKKKSCGCLHKEDRFLIGNQTNKNQKRKIKLYDKNEYSYRICEMHGYSRTRLYRIWQAMKTRCYNKRNKFYSCYGDRGIRVCEEWEHDFLSFRTWALENGYSENLSIDRIDVDGNYEPSNCRWADSHTQNINKRKK